jgi:hypothetical protein
MILPSVYFYIPQCYLPSTIPASADENWQGFGIGIYAWTLQTYLRLKADGFPCQLVSHLPDEGIILVHHNALRSHKNLLKPKPRQLLICIKAEGKFYPYAQLQIVQNPGEVLTLKDSYYLPHWTQPGLISRHPLRGDCFENIAFFGHTDSLAPELQDSVWEQQLKALGLRWLPIINRNRWNNYNQIDNRWNDYSNVDAIVAVRSFDHRQTYPNKPATKLYNAWMAGVPALLGAESAYQAEGEKNENYLEVTSINDLIVTLQQLKSDLALRQTLVKNGYSRVPDILPETIIQKWRAFFQEFAFPAFERWCETPRYLQQIILEKNYLICLGKRVQDKIISDFRF